MNGDFSRITFDPQNQYSRVLMQQGRALLDADWNEQAAILNHALRTFIRDLLGSHWGVMDGSMTAMQVGSGNDTTTVISVANAPTPIQNSFLVRLRMQDNNQVTNDFSINPGHYYVDGILCENSQVINYTSQQGPPTALSPASQTNDGRYLVYLDTWERSVNYLEDSNIREVALGDYGPDTAVRAKVIWQVRVPPTAIQNQMKEDLDSIIRQTGAARLQIIESLTQKLTNLLQAPQRGTLKARATIPTSTQNISAILSDAHYRGVENQLYRVEVHQGGPADKATFKWSRENGSVLFPIGQIAGNIVTLGDLGHDDAHTIQPGDWVEIVNDDYLIQIASDMGSNAHALFQVVNVDRLNALVTLSGAPDAHLGTHPLLCRWDQQSGSGTSGESPALNAGGTIPISESQDETGWLTLEDGIQIQFQSPPASTAGNMYRTGDYWLIPARTLPGDILWPQDPNQQGPSALSPHGVDHHYALLAIVSLDGAGIVTSINDLRYMLPPLARSLALVSQFAFPQ